MDWRFRLRSEFTSGDWGEGCRGSALRFWAGCRGAFLLVLVWVLPAMGQSSEVPAITSDVALKVVEGETAVATLTATDDDTVVSDLVWSLSGGADSDEFTLSGSGALAFGAAPDFEQPADADTDNVYEMTVQVSDGPNDVTADLVVTVDNVI